MALRLTATLGALLIACWTAAAFASPAVLYRDADVREGPGEEYPVLWNLVAGTHIDVRECGPDDWCRVVRRDKQGWMKVEHIDLFPGVDNGAHGTASSSGDTGSKSGQRPTFSKTGSDGTVQLVDKKRPIGSGPGTGAGEETAESKAQLASTVSEEGSPSGSSSGPTFTTLSGDTITTIGDAVVAASCPRCR